MNPSSEYNKQKKSLIFEVSEIYLFSKTGALITENLTRENVYNTQYYKQILPYLVQTTAKYNKKSKKLINHNIFLIKGKKIVTVDILTSNIISIAICSNESKSKLIYFFLLKITMAFLNYMKMQNCNNSYNIHSIIYETFLLSPIKNHFYLAIKEVFRRYTLYINNIHYKNYYLIDLFSNEIILSLETLYDQNTNGEVEMKISNKVIWNEILFHAHNLKRDYIKKNKNIFQIENLQDFYTKVEFKATYPRLTYIIKFLPLLGGMVLVHEYTQTKMSRIDGSEAQSYEEFAFEYGYKFDENNNFLTKNEEFLLNEPDVLIHIHFFIIECLLCNLDNIGFFVFHKYQKIYFSDEIIKLINKQIYSNIKISQFTEICSNKLAVHQLLEKIANCLYEEHVQINAQELESKESAMVGKGDNEVNNLNKSFYISYPDSLYISKKFTLNVIFNSGHLSKYININDISLDLSTEEENIINDGIYQALREKNNFNQNNDPYFYYRFHYAHASPESIQLMDLLNDNGAISEKEILIANNKNKFFAEPNDLLSLNVTDLSSRFNPSVNTINFPFNPYTRNILNRNIVPSLKNKISENNIYNMSSNSSQIKPFLKFG